MMAGPLAGSRDTLIQGRVDRDSHLSSQSRNHGQVVKVSAISGIKQGRLPLQRCPDSRCDVQKRTNVIGRIAGIKIGRSFQSGPLAKSSGEEGKIMSAANLVRSSE